MDLSPFPAFMDLSPFPAFSGSLSNDALHGVITHLRGMVVEEQDTGRRAKLKNAIQILREDDEPIPVKPPTWIWLTSVAAFLVGLVAGRFLIRRFPGTRPA